MQSPLRETFEAKPKSLPIINEQFERRARTIMEWKGGASWHCCHTFPPSPPHTGRARFHAPGVPNSILPGFPWAVVPLMDLKVTCLAESNRRCVLGLIGLYSRDQRSFPPKGCGVMNGCHRFFMASLTNTVGSVQGCQAGGKTASALPVGRFERHQIHRPILMA